MNKKFRFLEVLNEAYENHYAVPAFDYFNLFDAQVMIEEAQRAKTPLMLMESFPSYFNPKIWLSFAEAMAQEVSVPVFTHVDHAETVEYCLAAVDAGFDAVMIDASADSLEENIRKTKLVTDYAHKHGVAVEAEVGKIKNREHGAATEEKDFLVRVEDAVRLVKETGVDFLAVGIGNQHGFYVGEPHIHFDRLQEVNEALGIPLVMHGGSGLSREILQRAIQNGITKVNVYTDVACAYSKALRDSLIAQGDRPMFMRSCDDAMEGARGEIRRWIDTCMSAGKAKNT